MERNFLVANKGQMRVIEVILASFIIVFALSFANILAVTPTSSKYVATELEKMGYNALFDLDKQGLLASFVYNKKWADLYAALRVLLPSEVHFNLTIYYLDGTKANDATPIFYGDANTFSASKNIASVTYSLSGYSENKIQYDPRILVLQLATG